MGFGGTDDAASGIQGPELRTGFRADVDELAIWAAVADGEAIAKQEAATTVLKTTRAMGDGESRRYGPTATTDTAGAWRLRAAPGLRDRRELGGKTAPVGEGGGDGWRRPRTAMTDGDDRWRRPTGNDGPTAATDGGGRRAAMMGGGDGLWSTEGADGSADGRGRWATRRALRHTEETGGGVNLFHSHMSQAP